MQRWTLRASPCARRRPFALDSRLRDVQGEEPVTFFAGRDVRALPIHFLLEVRAWLGYSRGRKPNQPPALFEIETDSAIGRLALLSISVSVQRRRGRFFARPLMPR
jgi:hypothetical protein